MIPWAHPSPQPKRRVDWFSLFAQVTAECPYTLQWDTPPLPPKKLPFPMGGSEPNLTHGFLGPPEYSTQTASRSVEPFFAGLTSVTDRSTDHATQSVITGHLRTVRSTVMRHNNNNHLGTPL